MEDKESLENFAPQSNAAAQADEAYCRGWDPDKKEQIVGHFQAEPSSLGSEQGASAFGDKPKLEICDIPVRTKEEADAVAESALTERNMQFITGSLTTKGNPKIKVGTIVQIDANDKRYNGKYYVSGVRHKFSHGASGLGGGSGTGGFMTEVLFQRDAGMGDGGGGGS